MHRKLLKGMAPSRITARSPCPLQISVQHKISAIPKREDMVLWSSLHEAMFTPVSEEGTRGAW